MESIASINSYFTELEQMLRDISQAHLQDILSLLEAKNTIMPGAPRLKAISLTDHVPLITAWSNDTAYEHIFEEQLANMIEPGDLVIGISTSGNSPNVINALHLAKKSCAATAGLLGAKGGLSG